MPMMFGGVVRTSSASLANLMPPALPRPPTCTCALNDHRVGVQPFGCRHGIVDGGDRLARRHRNVERAEELFALVFEEVHGPSLPGRPHERQHGPRSGLLETLNPESTTR
jgi:hypothetical protein